MHQQFQMPAERLQAFGEGADRIDVGEGVAALVDDVDARTARASGVIGLQFLIGNTRIDGDNGAEFPVHPVDHVKHAGIVSAIYAGLGQYGTVNSAKCCVQRKV